MMTKELDEALKLFKRNIEYKKIPLDKYQSLNNLIDTLIRYQNEIPESAEPTVEIDYERGYYDDISTEFCISYRDEESEKEWHERALMLYQRHKERIKKEHEKKLKAEYETFLKLKKKYESGDDQNQAEEKSDNDARQKNQSNS